ncbi:MAG TPA: hypothetical protein VMI35_10045 [Puia sp.]|nr:hypothetical protein [Puia sp.]
MQYHILNKTIEIFSMKKPEGARGNLFEFHGNKALEEIGLREKFYFKAPDQFSLNPTEEIDPAKAGRKGIYKELLGIYLLKSIQYGELVAQGSL